MKLRGRACVVVVTTLLSVGVASSASTPASADGSGTVITTDGDSLHVWSAPTQPHQVLGTVAEGSTVTFNCYAQGDSVTGPYGTETTWDHLVSPYPGGWVTDAWIYTGSNSPVVPACDSSSSGTTYAIAWTPNGQGTLARSGPSLVDASVGGLLGDGTPVSPLCETYGDTITDAAGYSSNLWDQLPTGGYVSNAFVDTGVNGRTPGVPLCASPVAPVTSCPTFTAPTMFSDDIAYRLFWHYVWGTGATVGIYWSYFSADPEFVTAAMNVPVGGSALFTPADQRSDLFLGLGTFTIDRTSQQCYSISDHYDFTPDKRANLRFLPAWALQVAGAKEFYVYSAGGLQ